MYMSSSTPTRCLAPRWEGGGVDVATADSAVTETTTGECLPQQALVGACVSVDISLDPSITGGDD